VTQPESDEDRENARKRLTMDYPVKLERPGKSKPAKSRKEKPAE
jgi:hypothetical protein